MNAEASRTVLRDFLEERQIMKLDEIRGSILIVVMVFVFLSNMLLPVPGVPPNSLPVAILLGALMVYYGVLYRPIFYALVRRRLAFDAFKHLQSVMNLTAITVLVHFTGGIESLYAATLYIFEVLVSAVLLPARQAFWEASLGWLFYCLLLLLELCGLLPHAAMWASRAGEYRQWEVVLKSVLVIMGSLYIAAGVGTVLRRLLQDRSRELDRLQAQMETLSLQSKEQAISDGLTGVYNERYFRMRLVDEVLRALRFRLELSVLLLDVDGLKHFNRDNGRAYGDAALAEVGKVLRTLARSEDLPARLEGGRFALLLPQTNATGAAATAERLRSMVADHRFPSLVTEGAPSSGGQRTIDPLRSAAGGVGGQRTIGGHLTVSVGAATFPQDSAVPAALLSKADMALFVAKRQGRNQTVSYHEALAGV